MRVNGLLAAFRPSSGKRGERYRAAFFAPLRVTRLRSRAGRERCRAGSLARIGAVSRAARDTAIRITERI